MGALSLRLLAIGLAVIALSAQEPDLTSLSLEDFLNVEVTSVSKSRRKLSQSAAAVFVITQEDIRRSGAVSLPEALRMAPGVHVARIKGDVWAISIRGFNSINSNKLLVLIDGRVIYSPLLSGVLWNEHLLMLEDIERIEVIRGPGGTLWGANAMTGVINIITKDSTATQGGLAAISGGGFDPARVRARFGGRMGKQAAWRAWGQVSVQAPTRMPEISMELGRRPNQRAGMRVDWEKSPQDSLLFEGEVANAIGFQATEAVRPGGLVPGWQSVDTRSTQGYLLGRWTHTSRRGDDLVVQTHLAHDHSDGGIFQAGIRTLDLDLQQSFRLPKRHTLIAGGGARSNAITTVGTPSFSFEPANKSYSILNVFCRMNGS